MPLTSACQFVQRMKMDQNFRREVAATADTTAFRELLRSSGYDFSERDLVGAMARCMEEMGTIPPQGLPKTT